MLLEDEDRAVAERLDLASKVGRGYMGEVVAEDSLEFEVSAAVAYPRAAPARTRAGRRVLAAVLGPSHEHPD